MSLSVYIQLSVPSHLVTLSPFPGHTYTSDPHLVSFRNPGRPSFPPYLQSPSIIFFFPYFSVPVEDNAWGWGKRKERTQSSSERFKGVVCSSNDAHTLCPCQSNVVLVRVAGGRLPGTEVGLWLQATPEGISQGST